MQDKGQSSSDESSTRSENKRGRVSPILMAFYEKYAPYVQQSEDLTLNYLYPMQGNVDLWESIAEKFR